MLKNKIWLLVLIFVFFAGSLKFYKLGQIPSGMTWDEAAIAYNGFAIASVHRDEWLEFMPVSFRSFGDYKAPLAIYLNGLFTSVFGLNLWAIRLPFALAGCLTTIGGILLVWLLVKNKVICLKFLSLSQATALASIFWSFSPWHLLFSRVGFESGMALCQLVWAGNFFLIFYLFSKKYFKLSWLSLILTIILLISSFYTYHSAKLTVPLLFVLSMGFLYQKRRMINRLSLVMYPAITLVLLYPLLKDTFFASGLTRANVTVFADQPVFSALFTSFLQMILHLSPKFLLFGQTDSLRHSTGQMGVLLPVTFVFFVLGIAQFLLALIRMLKRKLKVDQVSFVGIVWIAAGLLPAAIGQEVPHPNRALLALPGFLLVSLVGFDWFYGWLKKLPAKFYRLILLALFVVHLSFFGKFFLDYFGEYQLRSDKEYLVGYLQVFELIWQYHNGTSGKPQVDQIVMTNEYGQPYIFALLTGKIDPIAYHNGALIKFLFVDKPNVGDLMKKNALVVSGAEVFNLDPNLARETIFDSKGQARFRVFYSGD